MAPILEPESAGVEGLGFTVYHQQVFLDIDPVSCSLKGHTHLILEPQSRDLKEIRLNCRQCQLSTVTINRVAPAGIIYNDPYVAIDLPYGLRHRQHDQFREIIEKSTKIPPEEELRLKLGKAVKIQDSGAFNGVPSLYEGQGAFQDRDGMQNAASQFQQIFVDIDFAIENIHDGLHFVGWGLDDPRQPHLFTTHSKAPGSACSLFPCVDDFQSRCYWTISVKCPKTIGDCFRRRNRRLIFGNRQTQKNNTHTYHQPQLDELSESFSAEDKIRELVVVCTGEAQPEVLPSLKV